MVKQCVVCKKVDYIRPDLSFHRFTTNVERRKVWYSLLGFEEKKLLPKSANICSSHFSDRDFEYKLNGSKYLKRDAKPMIVCSRTSAPSTSSVAESDDGSTLSVLQDSPVRKLNLVNLTLETSIDVTDLNNITTLRTVSSAKNTIYEDEKHTFPKPPYSYSCLIAMAIKNSKFGSLPVSEIYNFISRHFPYFQKKEDRWKNIVRHNLSLSKCFEKIEKPDMYGPLSKGCLWTINSASSIKVDLELQRRSWKYIHDIRKAMANPEHLEALERGEMKFACSYDQADHFRDCEDQSEDSISEQYIKDEPNDINTQSEYIHIKDEASDSEQYIKTEPNEVNTQYEYIHAKEEDISDLELEATDIYKEIEDKY